MTIKEKESSLLNLYADNSELFNTCEHLIFDNLWSTQLNKNKFKIIKHNHGKGIKTDTLLLSNMLIKVGYKKNDIIDEINEPDYRVEKNVSEYVNDVFDAWSKRLLLPILHRGHTELSSEIGDVVSNMDDLKAAISEIDSIKNNLSIDRDILDIFDDAVAEIMEAQNNTNETIGHSYGIKELNKLTSGAKQEVIVIGARPGMGKTSMIVNIAKHIAVDKNEPLIIFSLEMPAGQLMKNLIANILEINSWQIRSGNVADDDLLRIKKLRDRIKRNLIIDDTPAITYQYVKTKIQKVRKQLNIPMSQLITGMIDYLQLMKNVKEETVGKARDEQISDRCNGLLEISKTENVCMIELSQLSRTVESRVPPRPLMSDLKDGGAIEANASQVWLLYRPFYYGIKTDPKGVDVTNLCEINVAKNRYGETGCLYVEFQGKYSAFKDYNQDSQGITTNTTDTNEPPPF